LDVKKGLPGKIFPLWTANPGQEMAGSWFLGPVGNKKDRPDTGQLGSSRYIYRFALSRSNCKIPKIRKKLCAKPSDPSLLHVIFTVVANKATVNFGAINACNKRWTYANMGYVGNTLGVCGRRIG